MKVETFIKKFKSEIKKFQSYEGETYSEALKKAVAKAVKNGATKYSIAKASGINYTLVRNWDMKYNYNKKPNGLKIA